MKLIKMRIVISKLPVVRLSIHVARYTLINNIGGIIYIELNIMLVIIMIPC
jgi:hypothetical protein